MGELYSVQNKIDLSLEQYQKIIRLSSAQELSPGDQNILALTYNNLGKLYMDLGRFEEARSSLQEAIRLNEEQQSAFYNLGTSLLQLGHPSQAIPYLLRSLELSPMNAQTFNNLAVAYLALQEHEKARQALQLALKVDASHFEATRNLKWLNTHYPQP